MLYRRPWNLGRPRIGFLTSLENRKYYTVLQQSG